ncbi:MAG: hypothetical protein GC204_16445 [Chloroflexi bacterium]|nr:hypothetical protein [Chloroflexota bacterium]
MLKGYHLTLLIGPTIPMPVPQPVVQAFQSAQVTISSGQRSGFQVVFALSKTSLLTNALLPTGYFDPGMRVVLMVTVGGIPNVIMDGIITRQEVTASNDLGASILTITGEDVSVMMDLIKIQGIPFPSMPHAARVAILIAKYAIYGMIPVVIPELFPNISIPIQNFEFQEGTDLEYINGLAKENGYVFFVTPGPAPGTNFAYWGPEIRVGVPQPALNINMDAHTNVESMNFSFDGLSREQRVIMIQEPFSKMSIPIPLPDISLLSPPLALRQAPSLKIKPLEGSAKLNPILAMARGLGKTSESADAVSASGQLDVLRYGRVLGARQLVGVRGAGIAYDGLYYVKSVTHNLKPGEYKQSFTLARNGLVPLTPFVVP